MNECFLHAVSFQDIGTIWNPFLCLSERFVKCDPGFLQYYLLAVQCSGKDFHFGGFLELPYHFDFLEVFEFLHIFEALEDERNLLQFLHCDKSVL